MYKLRELILEMHRANRTWGAPRIHGELAKAYAERFVGSLRRECLDQVIAVNERQVCRIVSSYARYYNCARTHLALAKDAPEPREIQARAMECIVAFPEVGGLHHRYERLAA